ncbi:unnamed protein product [Ixodes persulcatus]
MLVRFRSGCFCHAAARKYLQNSCKTTARVTGLQPWACLVTTVYPFFTSIGMDYSFQGEFRPCASTRHASAKARTTVSVRKGSSATTPASSATQLRGGGRKGRATQLAGANRTSGFRRLVSPVSEKRFIRR